MRNTKLLAINFGGIGDEILFLPALSSIRTAHPDWHITLLLEPRSQSVRQITNVIDATIGFDIKKRPLHTSDLVDLLGLLRDGGFDAAISSGSSPLVAILLFLSGIGTRIGYDSGPLSRLLLTRAVTLNREQYAGAMYHDLVRGLSISTPPRLPETAIRPESTTNMRSLLAELEAGTTSGARGRQSRRVLIHPGTSRLAIEKGIIKTWSTESWASLVGMLAKAGEIEPILAGGPDDLETVGEIGRRCAGLNLISTAGRTGSLSDLAALISLCDLLVCVDSAPMHLAVALGKPLVALFGPTDERKLLPADPCFLALRSDPIGSFASPRAVLLSSTRRPTQGVTGVRIPPDTVFRAAMDQLRAISNQESSPELRR